MITREKMITRRLITRRLITREKMVMHRLTTRNWVGSPRLRSGR